MRCRPLLVVVFVAALAAQPAAATPAPAGSSPCSRFGPMARSGTLADARLVELSGLAASRRHGGVLWAHNDSGGAAQVFALGSDGRALGAYSVTGAGAVDWEDMAVGPGPGAGSYLYLGDIGDNGAERSSVTVYRVPEPSAAPDGAGGALGGAEAIPLRYPGGPADAEALLVDPRSGDLVIVTKALTGTSRVLVAPAAALRAGPVVTMTDAGTIKVPLPPSPGPGLPGTMVTGGDVSADGSTIALRTYRSVLLYGRGGGSLASALKGTACFGPQAEERQGEAVAFTRDGASVVTIGEGARAPVHRSGAPRAATTTTTPAAPAPGGGSGTGGGSGGSSGGGAGGAAGPTTTRDATTTTVEGTTTSTTRAERADDDVGPDGDGEEAAAAAGEPTSADDAGLSPLLLIVPVVVVAGAGALVWLRRRRPSAPA